MFQGELQEEIDKAIPHIVECLKDERSNVRGTTVSVLQSLGAYRMCPSVCPLLVS